MNIESNKRDANTQTVKKKTKMTRSKHNERLLGRNTNNQANVFKIESIELNKRENKIEKKTYEIRSDRGKSCEIISTNVEIIPTDDCNNRNEMNKELEEQKDELFPDSQKYKSLPRMNKFIDLIDLKRLPAPNSCSYQDDTINQSKANATMNTSLVDVDTVISKFDLITTDISNKYECNKLAPYASQKNNSLVTGQIDSLESALETQIVDANKTDQMDNKQNDVIKSDLPEEKSSLLDEDNTPILSEIEQTARFLVEATIENIRKSIEVWGEEAL
jgi:hypothetical protein